MWAPFFQEDRLRAPQLSPNTYFLDPELMNPYHAFKDPASMVENLFAFLRHILRVLREWNEHF